jgi:hypothetical protein
MGLGSEANVGFYDEKTLWDEMKNRSARRRDDG